MRLVAATLFFAAVAFGQKAVTLGELPAAVTAFEGNELHAPLPCTIEQIKPALNFGFRFQTGYVLRTSLDPYKGGKHHWYIVFRVTPEGGGQPVYFLDSIDIPRISETGFLGDSSGSFLVGEGRYDVKWSLLDDLGRVCRAEWTVDAHSSLGERSAKVTMPPGTVGDYSWRPALAVAPAPGMPARRITILMNAALPVRRQFGRLARVAVGSPAISQWETLVSVLSSLLEQIAGSSVRLVIFNLDQQREIFRQDWRTRRSMPPRRPTRSYSWGFI